MQVECDNGALRRRQLTEGDAQRSPDVKLGAPGVEWLDPRCVGIRIEQAMEPRPARCGERMASRTMMRSSHGRRRALSYGFLTLTSSRPSLPPVTSISFTVPMPFT